MKELEIEFDGKGKTKGFHYKQIRISPIAYIYEVTCDNDGYKDTWYEVFKRVENMGGTHNIGGVDVFFEPKVSYPNDNAFGVTAWCCLSLERANIRFESIKENSEEYN